MDVKTFSTFYKLENIQSDMRGALQIMESLSSITYNGDKVALGYMMDDNGNTLKIPKGYTYNVLSSILSKHNYNATSIEMPPTPSSKIFKVVNKKPYEYQSKVIAACTDVFNKHNQFIIDLPTGKGKTLTTFFMIEQLGAPALIIVKDKELKKQWTEGLFKSTNIKYDDICDITGSSSIVALECLHKPHPVYICTHAAMRNIIKDIGFKNLNRLLMKMGVGVKVVDEFDLEFRSTMEIDMNTAIKHNIYLTATPFKSSKNDNLVFQRVFGSVPRSGKEYFKDEVPNRDCEWVAYKSKPGPKERYLCFNFRGDFSPFNYNQYLFNKKVEHIPKLLSRHIRDFLENYDKEDKCIIFAEKIETCTTMLNILHSKFNIPMKDIGIINSGVTDKAVREEMFSRKFIISTVKSVGRGLDIPNLVYLINFETYASMSLLIQQVGRVGRVGGKKGKFINFVDASFNHILQYNRGKLKELDNLFDKINHLFFKTETESYVNCVEECD